MDGVGVKILWRGGGGGVRRCLSMGNPQGDVWVVRGGGDDGELRP